MEKVTILEDFKIPGTDVVLEKGDVIEIQSKNLSEAVPSEVDRIGDEFAKALKNIKQDRTAYYDLGQWVAKELISQLTSKLEYDNVDQSTFDTLFDAFTTAIEYNL